jgi:hypothetical protein
MDMGWWVWAWFISMDQCIYKKACCEKKNNPIVLLPLSRVAFSPSLSFVSYNNSPAAVGRPGVAAPPSEKLEPPPFLNFFAVFEITLLHLFIFEVKIRKKATDYSRSTLLSSKECCKP